MKSFHINKKRLSIQINAKLVLKWGVPTIIKLKGFISFLRISKPIGKNEQPATNVIPRTVAENR